MTAILNASTVASIPSKNFLFAIFSPLTLAQSFTLNVLISQNPLRRDGPAVHVPSPDFMPFMFYSLIYDYPAGAFHYPLRVSHGYVMIHPPHRRDDLDGHADAVFPEWLW
jgi:hypothetical protein